MLKSGGWDNKGAFSMCDYSLHNVKSRPAKVGDKLATRHFYTGTTGFAAPENQIVLLTRLFEGQKATVLQLPSQAVTGSVVQESGRCALESATAR